MVQPLGAPFCLAGQHVALFFFSLLDSVLRRRRRNNQFVIPPYPIIPCWSTSAMPVLHSVLRRRRRNNQFVIPPSTTLRRLCSNTHYALLAMLHSFSSLGSVLRRRRRNNQFVFPPHSTTLRRLVSNYALLDPAAMPFLHSTRS